MISASRLTSTSIGDDSSINAALIRWKFFVLGSNDPRRDTGLRTGSGRSVSYSSADGPSVKLSLRLMKSSPPLIIELCEMGCIIGEGDIIGLGLLMLARRFCLVPNRAFWWLRSDIDAADSMGAGLVGVFADCVAASIRSKSPSKSSSSDESLSSPDGA